MRGGLERGRALMAKGFWLDARDMYKLEKSIKRLGDLPPKLVAQAARQGANVILRQARIDAPKYTGLLRRAITVKSEKPRVKGKRFFQVTFNKKYTDQLAKISKANKRSYYPVSQEYGFLTRSGTKVPGKRYLRNAADSKAEEFKRVAMKELIERVDKEWKKNAN